MDALTEYQQYVVSSLTMGVAIAFVVGIFVTLSSAFLIVSVIRGNRG